MIIIFKIEHYLMLNNHLLGNPAYPYDCTFFRLICLTAKTLHSTTMRSFLVGATRPKKRTLKWIQLRDSE